jgi:hypothetical protein
MRRAGRLLGLSDADSHFLQKLFWTRLYPRERAKYRSSNCVENDPLDDSPHDGVWP